MTNAAILWDCAKRDFWIDLKWWAKPIGVLFFLGVIPTVAIVWFAGKARK
jgi:hypothetical protein